MGSATHSGARERTQGAYCAVRETRFGSTSGVASLYTNAVSHSEPSGAGIDGAFGAVDHEEVPRSRPITVEHDAPQLSPQLRDPPVAKRCGFAGRSRIIGARKLVDNAKIHAREHSLFAKHLSQSASAELK